MIRKFTLSLLSILLFQNILLSVSDKIIAIVNKDVITQSEADANLKVLILQFSQQYKGDELQERIKEEKDNLINNIIEDKIILQEAKRQGIRPRPEAVKDRMEEIKRNFPKESDFESLLRERGLTIGDFERRLGEQIIMREIIERKVKDKINVNPDEVTKYFNEHKEDFLHLETRVVDMFYLNDESNIEKLIQDFKNGVNPQEIAKQYNATYTRDSVSKKQLRPEIGEVVFSLQNDEISKPINLEGVFYIFKLIEIKPEKIDDLSSVHNKIFSYLYREKFNRKMAEWLEELKAKAYIEIK